AAVAELVVVAVQAEVRADDGIRPDRPPQARLHEVVELVVPRSRDRGGRGPRQVVRGYGVGHGVGLLVVPGVGGRTAAVRRSRTSRRFRPQTPFRRAPRAWRG